MKNILKIVAVLFVFTAVANAVTVDWYTRDHSDQAVKGFPAWQARHIQFKPSLAGGTGSNDFMIGPFDISKAPVYPQAVTVLMKAITHDATNDDILAFMTFEVKIDSTRAYAAARIQSATYTDSNWIVLDSININNSQDSTYPGLSTLNGGDAVIFDFPPGVEAYRFFWDIKTNADSLKSIEMFLTLIP